MKSVSAHATRPSVTLASGEVLSADVVVGADGYLNGAWFTRTYVMDAHEQEDTKTPTGMQMFRCMCVWFRFALGSVRVAWGRAVFGKGLTSTGEQCDRARGGHARAGGEQGVPGEALQVGECGAPRPFCREHNSHARPRQGKVVSWYGSKYGAFGYPVVSFQTRPDVQRRET